MSYYKIDNVLSGFDGLGGPFSAATGGGGGAPSKGKSGGKSSGYQKQKPGASSASASVGKRTSVTAAGQGAGGGSIADQPGVRQAAIKQTLSRLISGINAGSITAFAATQANLYAAPIVLGWKESGAPRSSTIPFELIDQGIRNLVQTAKDSWGRKAQAIVAATLPAQEKSISQQDVLPILSVVRGAVADGFINDFVSQYEVGGAYHLKWSRPVTLGSKVKVPVAYKVLTGGRPAPALRDVIAAIVAAQSAQAGQVPQAAAQKVQQDAKAIADKTLTKAQALGMLQGVRARVQAGTVTDFDGKRTLVKNPATQQMQTVLRLMWTATDGKKQDYLVIGANVDSEIVSLVEAIIREQSEVASAKAAASAGGSPVTGPAANELTALADALRKGIAAGNITSMQTGLNVQARLFVKWVDRGSPNSRLFLPGQSTPDMVALFASIAASIPGGKGNTGGIKDAIDKTKEQIDKAAKDAQDKSKQGDTMAADAALSQVQALQAQLQNLQQQLADALAAQTRSGGGGGGGGGGGISTIGGGGGGGGGGSTETTDGGGAMADKAPGTEATPVVAAPAGWWASQSTGMKAAIIGGAAAVLLGGGYLLMKKKPTAAAAKPGLKPNRRRAKRSKKHECHVCGERFEITPSGIAQHVDRHGNVDYDADADHVPYSLEPNPRRRSCSSCGCKTLRPNAKRCHRCGHARGMRRNGVIMKFGPRKRALTAKQMAKLVGALPKHLRTTKLEDVRQFREHVRGKKHGRKLRSNGPKLDAAKKHAARAWSWAKPRVKKHGRKAAKAGARGAAWTLRHGAGAMAHLSRRAHAWSMAPNKSHGRNVHYMTFR